MTVTDTQVTWLTQEAYDRLKAELDELIANRPVIAAEINARREEGDLKENGGYHAAREEQGQQEARIRQLQELLRTAQVGTAPTSSDTAAPGMVLKIRYDGDDDTETVLLGSREEGSRGDLRGHVAELAAGCGAARRARRRHPRVPAARRRQHEGHAGLRGAVPGLTTSASAHRQARAQPGSVAPGRARRPRCGRRRAAPPPARRSAPGRGSPASAPRRRRRAGGRRRSGECATSSTLAPSVADQREQLGQRAGPVADPHPQREVARRRRPCRAGSRAAARAGRRCRRRAPRPPGVANRVGCSSSAATAAAPAGSTSSFARSRQCSSARDSASSSTVMMSSTSAADLRERDVARAADGDPVGDRAHRRQRRPARPRPATPARPPRPPPAPRPPRRPAAAPAPPRRRRRAARHRRCTTSTVRHVRAPARGSPARPCPGRR